MSERPSVFPTPEQRAEAAKQVEAAAIAAYEAEKTELANHIYTSNQIPSDTPQLHVDAVEMMRKRTEEQEMMRANGTELKYPELAEGYVKPTQETISMNKRTEEQMRLRDEAMARNIQQTQNYQKYSQEATERRNDYSQPQPSINDYSQNLPPVTPPPTRPVDNGYNDNYGKNPSNINPYIFELSQPNYNSPFDVIELPSKGKTYRSKRANVRISYMTTADENILTSPNLLQSGEFLEILMNRKILEPELRYKDLLVGDRNAIMIWLRATGYGEMYPVTLFDENDVPFDTQINLNDLKTKNLGVEPDEEGLFNYHFKLSNTNIKFKFITCGVADEIDRMVEQDKLNGFPLDKTNTYTMERMIVEVNGSRDRNDIKEFSNSIRILDARQFNEYVTEIESGIDLNITVGTPGGGSINTFLPLNLNFFWPDLRV